MARKTMRAPLVLTDESRELLTELSGSMTAPIREVVRAKVLLLYADGTEISSIKRQVGISRPAIYKCIDKALAAGAQAGLKDAYHSQNQRFWMMPKHGLSAWHAQSPRIMGLPLNYGHYQGWHDM